MQTSVLEATDAVYSGQEPLRPRGIRKPPGPPGSSREGEEQ